MHNRREDGNVGTPAAADARSATDLYDAFAASYDERFEPPSLRAAYDQLAWEWVEPLLPPAPARIVDVGCGTGRWAARCHAMGHAVVGVEPSKGMQDVLRHKFADAPFELVTDAAETADLPDASVDAVLAMGSLQYMHMPERVVARMAQWLRPGGLLCVHVDGLFAVVVELVRLGRTEEAMQRVDDGHGIFTFEGRQSFLHLFNAARLAAAFRDAGLRGVEIRGLLVQPTMFDRARCEGQVVKDYDGFLAAERRLSRNPAMSDAGKHLLCWGRAAG